MERLVATLLLVLVIAVVGLGVVTWRADDHAQTRTDRLLCLERAQATAAIVLLTPSERIDEEGRLDAVKTLSARVDAC
jgi:hypothetical protein